MVQRLTAGFALAVLAAATHAAGTTTVRSIDYHGFGRIVIDTTGTPAFFLDQDGDHVLVRFNEDIALGPAPALPRNAIAIKTTGSAIEITLKRGARVRSALVSGRVLLDLSDAANDAAPPPSAKILPMAPLSMAPLSMAASVELGGRSMVATATPPLAEPAAVAEQPPAPLPPMKATQAAPSPPVREAAPQAPPAREANGPLGLRARRVRLPKEMDGSAFLAPFDSTTGAAAFRSGDAVVIVFDERRAIDMAALRNDPVFGAATVQLLPNGTLLRAPMPAEGFLTLTQMAQGWRIAILSAQPKRLPIAAAYAEGRLSLAADQPGDVVSLADPATGATLLVGTQHRPGQGVVTSRRGTEFILRATLQGVVVEPLSDAIALKRRPTGFSLDSGPAGLALSSAASMTDAAMDAVHLTRRLNFPTVPTEVLLRRSIKQLAAAAAAPPLARGPKHHAAAESFLALGMAAEAGSLLRIAAEQDPKEAASADTAALAAIAALLAGRVEESGALADHRLDGTDEIALWRAVREAVRDEGSPAAAAVFAATAPLALQYPEPIRGRILPLMVETMIQGGEAPAAARLLNDRKNDPKLAFARALMRQADGDASKALAELDALADGHDQFDHARAAIRAVELRLAAQQIDKAQAADALDKLLYAWRGDARELALRERVADLRGQAGQWPMALATLRQAEADFPEQAAAVHERLKDSFAAMIHDQGSQQAPPIEFVAVVNENTDLVPDAGDDEPMEQSLAERLLALDLPNRAKPVLEKLMGSAKSDAAKARFGFSLATLDAREGDDPSALAALDASAVRDLPPELTEQRLLLRAAVVARLGDPAAGAALLLPAQSGEANKARAQILESASDWAGAERAWADYVALTVPAAGALDGAGQQTVLRLATATARAHDDAGLNDLRLRFAGRIGAGPVGDMFRLLIAEPIRTTGDIERSQREITLAASLPADLKRLQASDAGH